MSLQLMKERIKHSGSSAREEMIIDGRNLLKEELEHDSSYSHTTYFWNPVLECDDRPAKLRIYKRKYSSLNGNYQQFLTTYDNPVKIGEYIHDIKDDTYWLIYNSFNVNDIHYEGKMIQCNYLLKWQLSDGNFVNRWANIVSASKYDVGENGNYVIRLSSNNYTVLIGFCEEGFELDGKRVFIDMKTINPIKVFKITRSDDVIYNSGGIGQLLSFIADKTEFNPNKDNQELRICDYIEPSSSSQSSSIPVEMTDLSCVIKYRGNPVINIGGYSKTFSAEFTDGSNNLLSDITPIWNVTTINDSFNKYIHTSIEDEKLLVRVDYNESLLGLKIRIDLRDNNNLCSSYLLIELGGGI